MKNFGFVLALSFLIQQVGMSAPVGAPNVEPFELPTTADLNSTQAALHWGLFMLHKTGAADSGFTVEELAPGSFLMTTNQGDLQCQKTGNEFACRITSYVSDSDPGDKVLDLGYSEEPNSLQAAVFQSLVGYVTFVGMSGRVDIGFTEVSPIGPYIIDTSTATVTAKVKSSTNESEFYFDVKIEMK